MKVSNAAANDFAVDLLARMDGGAAAGSVKFYTGTQPAGPDTAITSQVLLGTLTLSDPSAIASGRTLTFESVTEDASADNDGTATWCRVLDSDGVAVMDCSAGEAGSGPAGADPDFVMNSSAVVTGGPIRILSAVITF
jgi:hypothetical protein